MTLAKRLREMKDKSPVKEKKEAHPAMKKLASIFAARGEKKQPNWEDRMSEAVKKDDGQESSAKINSATSIDALDKAAREEGLIGSPDDAGDGAGGDDGDKNDDQKQDDKKQDDAKNETSGAGLADEITPTIRKQYNIPEKFKSLSEFVKSYAELEKHTGRVQSERDQLKSQIDQKTEDAKKSVDDQVKTGSLTASEGEAKKKMVDRIKEKYGKALEDQGLEVIFSIAADMLDAVNGVVESDRAERAKKEEQAATQSKMMEQLQSDYNEIVSEIGKEKFDEIHPELVKLAEENPRITSLSDAYNAWYRKNGAAILKTKEEEEAKKSDRAKMVETGGKTRSAAGASHSGISESRTLKELEAAARREGIL